MLVFLKDTIKELRLAIGICALWFSICFAFCLLHWVQIISFIIKAAHIKDATFVTKNITSGAFVAINTSFYISVLLLLPLICLFIYKFVALGLFKKERRFFIATLISSIILGFTGVAFGFFVFTPMFLHFFNTLSLIKIGVVSLVDTEHLVNLYISFCITGLIVFQTPLIVCGLLKLGIITSEVFTKYRKFYIVIYLIIGAVITPPDVISQVLVAFVLWILTESGFLFFKFICKK
jgi:sec-independent protein translocase protein TatC